MQTASTSAPESRGFLSRVDDAVFAVERTLVAILLMAITVMIFLDVVFRRLITPETKLGNVLAGLLDVDDPQTLALLHERVAPLGYALIGFLLLWFCTSSAQRELSRPLLGIRKGAPLIVATVLFLGVLGLLWMMLHVKSRFVYIALAALSGLGYAAAQIDKKEPGFRLHAALAVLVVPPFSWFALHYFPDGYAWSKEMSLMLLMWVGFFGASICVHEGKHLFVEAVISKLPPKLARMALGVGFLIAGAFCMLMALLGYRYTFDPEIGAMHLGGVLELTRLPDWISALPLPIAFALAGLRFLAASVSHFTGGRYGQISKAEGVAEAEKLAHEGAEA